MFNSFMNIFNWKSDKDFTETALEIFRFQSSKVTAYKNFIKYLNIDPYRIKSLHDIPFMPVELFKHHKITPQGYSINLEFMSSGTTGSVNSRHFIHEPFIYNTSILKSFKKFYGLPQDYCFLALLPSYLEKGESSLVYMADLLIRESGHPNSGFYLDDFEALIKTLYLLKETKQKVILLGVSFALLDLAEKYSPDLSSIIIMETGGMKGRKKEIVREELHTLLRTKFNVASIHSEYGMTEILSQAYSVADGIFNSPPWMKIIIRDPYDPMSFIDDGKTGAVSIIDLANIYSCSFISTSDIGRNIPGRGFEILGRMNNSDLRGCNLLIA